MTIYRSRHSISLIPDHSEQDQSLFFFQNQVIIDSLAIHKNTQNIEEIAKMLTKSQLSEIMLTKF